MSSIRPAAGREFDGNLQVALSPAQGLYFSREIEG